MAKRNTVKITGGPTAPEFVIEREVSNDGWIVRTYEGSPTALTVVDETLRETPEESVVVFRDRCRIAVGELLASLGLYASVRREEGSDADLDSYT